MRGARVGRQDVGPGGRRAGGGGPLGSPSSALPPASASWRSSSVTAPPPFPNAASPRGTSAPPTLAGNPFSPRLLLSPAGRLIGPRRSFLDETSPRVLAVNSGGLMFPRSQSIDATDRVQAKPSPSSPKSAPRSSSTLASTGLSTAGGVPRPLHSHIMLCARPGQGARAKKKQWSRKNLTMVSPPHFRKFV